MPEKGQGDPLFVAMQLLVIAEEVGTALSRATDAVSELIRIARTMSGAPPKAAAHSDVEGAPPAPPVPVPLPEVPASPEAAPASNAGKIEQPPAPEHVVMGSWTDDTWSALRDLSNTRPLSGQERADFLAGPRAHPYGPGGVVLERGGKFLVFRNVIAKQAYEQWEKDHNAVR